MNSERFHESIVNELGEEIKHSLVLCVSASAIFAMLILADISRQPDKQITARMAVWAVQMYQLKLHRFTHPFVRCRLQPTCSRFALLTLRKEGSPGVFKVARRLWICSRTSPRQNAGLPTNAQTAPSGPRLLASLALIQANASNPDSACGACLAGTGGLILLVVAWFFGSIALLVWVARDAKNRSVENPILWMLLVLVLFVIGLAIYLLARPGGNLVPCEHCNHKKLQYARLCPHCGNVDPRSPTAPTREVKEVYLEHDSSPSPAKVEAQRGHAEVASPTTDKLRAPATTLGPEETQAFCEQCGTKLDPGARFCDECGAEI